MLLKILEDGKIYCMHKVVCCGSFRMFQNGTLPERSRCGA